MRLIQQLSHVVAQLLRLREEQKMIEAEQLLDKSEDELFAEEAALLRIVDEQTAAKILGRGERIQVYAHLCLQRAENALAAGNQARAIEQTRRAGLLFRAGEEAAKRLAASAAPQTPGAGGLRAENVASEIQFLRRQYPIDSIASGKES